MQLEFDFEWLKPVRVERKIYGFWYFDSFSYAWYNETGECVDCLIKDFSNKYRCILL